MLHCAPVPTSQENVVVFRILVLVFENEILSMSRRNGIMVPMFTREWCLVFANVCSVVMADVCLKKAHHLASNPRNIAPPLSRGKTFSLSLSWLLILCTCSWRFCRHINFRSVSKSYSVTPVKLINTTRQNPTELSLWLTHGADDLAFMFCASTCEEMHKVKPFNLFCRLFSPYGRVHITLRDLFTCAF